MWLALFLCLPPPPIEPGAPRPPPPMRRPPAKVVRRPPPTSQPASGPALTPRLVKDPQPPKAALNDALDDTPNEPASAPTLQQSLAAAAKPAHVTARGVLADMRQAMQEHIAPMRSKSFGKALVAQLWNDFDATRTPGTIASSTDNPATAVASPSQRGGVPPPAGEPGASIWAMRGIDAAGGGKMCFGNCGQKHEVARLTVHIVFEHTPQGQVRAWHVLARSGSDAYDNYVFAQMRWLASRKWVTTKGEPIVKRSEWLVSAVQYFFGPIEKLLDPGFKLRELETEIRLLSFD